MSAKHEDRLSKVPHFLSASACHAQVVCPVLKSKMWEQLSITGIAAVAGEQSQGSCVKSVNNVRNEAQKTVK